MVERSDIMQFSIKKKPRNIFKWELVGSHLSLARQGVSNELKSAIFLFFLQHGPSFSPVVHHERAVKNAILYQALILCITRTVPTV
jgi:hypothetical protein